MVDEGFEDGGEESYGSEAHHAYRHVGCLDTGVEKDPVKAEQGAAACYLPHLPDPHFGDSCEDQQDQGSEEHSIPHDVDLVECDEFSEQSGETRQKDTQVQLPHAFLAFFSWCEGRGCHALLLVYGCEITKIVLNNPFKSSFSFQDAIRWRAVMADAMLLIDMPMLIIDTAHVDDNNKFTVMAVADMIMKKKRMMS